MTCRILYDDHGTPVGMACGSPWGVGTYQLHGDDAAEFGEQGYGFAMDGMSPEDFDPDPDSCTPSEIAAHAEALRVWRATRALEAAR